MFTTSLQSAHKIPHRFYFPGHMLLIPPTSNTEHHGLPLLLHCVLGGTFRGVHRFRVGRHGDPDALEHEITTRSTSGVIGIYVMGRMVAKGSQCRAKGYPI